MAFRKILYFLMTICGLCVLATTLIFPLYNFDNEKTFKNYAEYEYYLESEAITLGVYTNEGKTYIDLLKTGNATRTTVESAEEFNKDIYNKEVSAIYAAMHNDEEGYYEANKYEIVNYLFFYDTTNANCDFRTQTELTVSDTDTTINPYIEQLKNEYLKDLYVSAKQGDEDKYISYNRMNVDNKYFEGTLTSNAECTNELNAQIGTVLYNEKKAVVVNDKLIAKQANVILKAGLDENTCKTNIGLIGTYDVMSGLFMLVDETSNETATADVAKYQEKGISLSTLVDSWKNVVEYYKVEFNSESLKNQTVIKKALFVLDTKQGYDVYPLVLISALVIYMVTMGLGFTFGGLRGMKGKKYPKKFIKAAVLAGLSFIIFSRKLVIPVEYILQYHTLEYARLLDLFLFGNFSFVFLVAMFAGLLCMFISIIGKFFKWNEKPKKNKKEPAKDK